MTTNECTVCKVTGPDLPRGPKGMWRGFKTGVLICVKCYASQYNAKNRSELSNKRNQWVKQNKEKFKAIQKRYNDSGKAKASRDKLISKNPEYYRRRAVERANKAKILNPDKYLGYQRCYQGIRSRLKRHKLAEFYKSSVQEFYCNRPENMTVDHIIPLKNDLVCGLHVPWNLQYISQSQNSIKSNSFDGTIDNLSWRKNA